MLSFEKIIRKNIREMAPYSSARDEFSSLQAVFLDANENPFNNQYSRYPDPRQKELKEKICRIKGTEPSEIFLGNGSDEAIDLLFRVFCEPRNDNVIIAEPTYGMYRVCAEMNDVKIKTVWLTKDYQLNVAEMLKAVDLNTKLMFICSPNNPTSNSFNPSDMLALIRGFRQGLVILDEAYIDFSTQESMLKYMDEFENLVILQTFSKAWGMAGIRLGMAMAHPQIIQVMSKVKYPYNINQLTQQVALKALSNIGNKNAWVKEIILQRERLENELKKLPYVTKIHPSDSNFLLVCMDKPDEVYQYLIQRKIVVRNRSKVNLCMGCLRITVGTPAENTELLNEMSRINIQNLN